MADLVALTGADGELIDRFIEAIDSEHWVDLTWYVVFAVSGQELMGLTPDTGHVYAPGTVGAERMATHKVVSRTDYLSAIRRRLAEIVNMGVREDVLISGLRDDLSRRLRDMTATERADAKRAETRADLEAWAEDTEKIDRFRTRMAQSDPSYASRSDDEIAQDFRRMASRLEPVPPEQELALWAMSDHWDARVRSMISDDALSEWLTLHARHVTK